MRYGDDTLGCYCGGIRVRYPCPRCEQKLMVPRRGSYMRYCHRCGQDRVCEMVRGLDLCVASCARQQEQEQERAKLVEHVIASLRKCGLTTTECQRRGGCAGHECDETENEP